VDFGKAATVEGKQDIIGIGAPSDQTYGHAVQDPGKLRVAGAAREIER
jgi:hypothetical protein